jgi:hypothetical protein
VRETHELGKIHTISDGLKQPLRYDKPSGQRLFRLLLHNLLQDPLQILHVVMLIVPDRAPANLQSLPNSIIDRAIRNNDIPSLAKAGNHTRDSGESLRIHDTLLRPKTRGNVRLRLHMNILRAVELRRATRSHAIRPERLDSLLLDLLITNKIVEIVGREIRHHLAVRELDLRARRSAMAFNQHTSPLKDAGAQTQRLQASSHSRRLRTQ